MKEDSEKERIEQLEQEELEKKKRLSRRSSSPAIRQQPETEAFERSAHSEPIPRNTQFVSFKLFFFTLISERFASKLMLL
jgi:hypothetical protein